MPRLPGTADDPSARMSGSPSGCWGPVVAASPGISSMGLRGLRSDCPTRAPRGRDSVPSSRAVDRPPARGDWRRRSTARKNCRGAGGKPVGRRPARTDRSTASGAIDIVEDRPPAGRGRSLIPTRAAAIVPGPNCGPGRPAHPVGEPIWSASRGPTAPRGIHNKDVATFGVNGARPRNGCVAHIEAASAGTPTRAAPARGKPSTLAGTSG